MITVNFLKKVQKKMEPTAIAAPASPKPGALVTMNLTAVVLD